MNKIFVSIACYEDLDVIATCKDLIAKAVNPDALRVVVVLQSDNPTAYAELKALKQVELHEHPSSWATGVGKPRRFAYDQLRNEQYFFQTDCHMRFQPRWDETLLNELNACPPKAVLSSLPPGFLIETGELLSMAALAPKPSRFVENVPVSDFVEVPAGLPSPPKIAHIAASVLFCTVEAIHASPPDPHYNYYGEELSHSLRWWTKGYNMFAVRSCIAHHAYQHNNPRPQAEFNTNVIRHWRSTQRVDGLLNVQPRELLSQAALIDLDLYSLGTERSVASWEVEFGINLAQRKILSAPQTSDYAVYLGEPIVDNNKRS